MREKPQSRRESKQLTEDQAEEKIHDSSEGGEPSGRVRDLNGRAARRPTRQRRRAAVSGRDADGRRDRRRRRRATGTSEKRRKKMNVDCGIKCDTVPLNVHMGGGGASRGLGSQRRTLPVSHREQQVSIIH